MINAQSSIDLEFDRSMLFKLLLGAIRFLGK